ncbi:glycosyltransferase family 4 protein [Pseudomonas sp. LA21]|uniref:glycosyltransferase family 4 protein n=1 Tax=unclassified Pseudomonas TaxID=196821 RepID=UPI001FB811CB|nr:glycosyltransferase family 4 protein [Pseudomonas sp. LA21]MCJ1883434.1 glycosyltransferase family 4 protein [Pseudomonas sp. LA21]
MIISLISQNASPGLLIFRKDLILSLVEQGHKVYCFAVDYDSTSRDFITRLGATPIDYSLNKAGLNPFRDIRDILALSKELKAIRSDIAISFFVKPSMYGTLAAKLAGVPRRIAMLEGLGYIYTPSPSGFSLKKKILQAIHGLLSSVSYFFAEKVLFLNHDDPADLLRKAWIKKEKIFVVGPIGLDLNFYPYSPVETARPVRFIFIARLLAEKGIFEYLEAARLVKRHYPNSEFVVLGGLDPDNPTALSNEQLQTVIDEGIIIYPGHVSNVPDWIVSSHVFVLPSYREGFPRSTQEAMAIGRAVITTDTPGCRNTVSEGVNGYLVPPWNSALLAEKMLHLIEHPEKIRRMGDESNRIAVENYDVHRINSVFTSLIVG